MKPTKVAIYARVSTADQNADSQLFALREYAERRGFAVHREYIDHVTGCVEKRSIRGKVKDQAYQQLMADVRRRQVDCVLVWKYDRFARSLGVLIAALQEFGSLGVDFISFTQNIDTTTPMGRLFFHVIGSFAEFERELIVERVLDLNYIITLCAEEVCPVVVSRTAKKLHWPFSDPAGHQGSDAERLAKFRTTRDQIQEKIAQFAKDIEK